MSAIFAKIQVTLLDITQILVLMFNGKIVDKEDIQKRIVFLMKLQCVEQCRLFGLICDKCEVYKAICSRRDSIIINSGQTPITFTLPQDVNSETVIIEPQNVEIWGIIVEKANVHVSMRL